eukprot:TRINITY_DN14078_c0_g1_i2.p1 TRINITY_DN14078_c0_g1~~TRINITY_DN14078_c0_g1_i2.p1  ORF type:complete len:272 (+),score=44.32 TRINITY_DN14078_c0_g1_i2:64-879(+)
MCIRDRLINKLQKIFSVKKIEQEQQDHKVNYVVTPDNFLKMIIIYLMINSGSPVILLGETGCGKTALIRFLVNNILHENYEIFNVHAGVDNVDIQTFVEKVREKAIANTNQDIWVFFDEFNTTKSVGVFSEIMIHRRLQGDPLPTNIKFVAACNPYKLRNKNTVNSDVYLERGDEHKLLHDVQKIPSSLIEYVMDFGSLTDEDKRKYIMAMVIPVCTNFKRPELVTELILDSMSNVNSLTGEASSTSLRDCLLYTSPSPRDGLLSRMPSSA